jgi:hypothetical protein
MFCFCKNKSKIKNNNMHNNFEMIPMATFENKLSNNYSISYSGLSQNDNSITLVPLIPLLSKIERCDIYMYQKLNHDFELFNTKLINSEKSMHIHLKEIFIEIHKSIHIINNNSKQNLHNKKFITKLNDGVFSFVETKQIQIFKIFLCLMIIPKKILPYTNIFGIFQEQKHSKNLSKGYQVMSIVFICDLASDRIFDIMSSNDESTFNDYNDDDDYCDVLLEGNATSSAKEDNNLPQILCESTNLACDFLNNYIQEKQKVLIDLQKLKNVHGTTMNVIQLYESMNS